MSQHETKLKSHVIFTGKVVTLNHDDVLLPDGSTAKREVVHHPGGVCIAALQGEDIYMISQYRYSYDEQLLELPAGKLEKGEDPYVCALRELREETGLQAKSLTFLGNTYPTVGYCDEIIRLFFADEFEEEVKEQHLDEDEFLNVVKMPFEKVYNMVLDGTIKDGKTQVGILKIAALLQQKNLSKKL